jgi:hypothetical protein
MRKISALILDGVRYALNDQGRHETAMGRAKRRDLKGETREWAAVKVAERLPVVAIPPEGFRRSEPAAPPPVLCANETEWCDIDASWPGEADAECGCGLPAYDFNQGSYLGLDC